MSKACVVVDGGSLTVRAGLSNMDRPSHIVPAVVGRPKHLWAVDKTESSSERAYYCGMDALARRGILNIKYPIEHGYVTNWETMRELWTHIFNSEMKINPSERGMMCTEMPLCPKSLRHKMTEIMFDTYEVPRLYAAPSAVLALYAAGRSSGLVLESGEYWLHAVPVYEGYTVKNGIMKLDIAGRDLTDYMHKMITGNIEASNDTETMSASLRQLEGRIGSDIARSIKERICRVAPFGFGGSISNATPDQSTASFVLPDGTDIQFPSAFGLQCPEALFTPRMIAREYYGVHDLVYNSIRRVTSASETSPSGEHKCVFEELRTKLYGNVLLCGGNMAFEGLADRLGHELYVLAKQRGNEADMRSKINVIGPTHAYSAWVGGCVLSQLSAFQNMWISKDEYNETGCAIIDQKCF